MTAFICKSSRIDAAQNFNVYLLTVDVNLHK